MKKFTLGSEMGNRKGKKGPNGLLKEVLGLGVTALALVAALLFVFRGPRGLAWFSNNDKVNADGMSVSAESGAFELAVVATPNPAANDSEDGSHIVSYSAANYLSEAGFSIAPITGGSNLGIYCELTSSTGSIGPGSYGELLFYVVGYECGEVDFNVELTGFKLNPTEGATPKEVRLDSTDTDDTTLLKYMAGHFLFFRTRDDISAEGEPAQYRYSDRLVFEEQLDGSIKCSFAFTPTTGRNITIGGTSYYAYSVSVYWIWPKLIANIIDSENSNAVFTDTSAADDDFDKILEFINTGTNWQMFFSEECSAELSSYLTGNAEQKTEALRTLNEHYNSADQFIGKHLEHIVLIFNASPSTSGD